MLEGVSHSFTYIYYIFYNRGKTMAQTSKYKRVVLKLSGEALAETKVLSINQSLLKRGTEVAGC